MTTAAKRNDAELDAPASNRRLWKRRDWSQGSSQLSLKAMAVLYDAGEPISRNEIAERLLPRLDAYERDYLEAWQLRRLEQQAKWNAKYRQQPERVMSRDRALSVESALNRWLMEVFVSRIHQGSLIRDEDGRYRPGPRTPRVRTLDGKLKRFTPEVRREVEQAEHDAGREHLVQLEFERVVAALDIRSTASRAELVCFLVRQHYGSASTRLLGERALKRACQHLARVADTATVRAMLLRVALDFLVSPERTETCEDANRNRPR